MRIAIVNDLVMAVEALRRLVLSVPGYEVAWVGRDGAEAVAQCAKDTPDLVLMDLIMPVMDGVEATRRIMKESPCAILVVTATVTGNSSKVFDAMGHGALDAVNTPVLGTRGEIEGGDALLAKIVTIGRLIGKTGGAHHRRTSDLKLVAPSDRLPPLVAIGASTGGPKALADVLSRLPGSFGAAVVIVQHVDVQFAPGMAAWLNDQTPLRVRTAFEGAHPEVGTVWLAGTNDHLILTPGLTLGYTTEPRDFPYRPSVDVFYRSLVTHWPRKDVAALLTGMGRDGAEGLAALRRAGWHTIAQDEATSVVYGMPKAAAEMGAAVQVLPIEQVAPAIAHEVGRKRKKET